MKRLWFLLIPALLASCAGPPRPTSENQNSGVRGSTFSNQSSNIESAKSDTTSPPANSGRSGESVPEAGPVDFSNGLPRGWSEANGGKGALWKFLTGRLEIAVPPDRIFSASAQDAPRIERVIAGDFEIRARVGLVRLSEGNAAGLFILRNDVTFVRFELGFEDGPAAVLRSAEEGALETLAYARFGGDSAELLLRRKGPVVEAFWRAPGAGRWEKAGRATTGYPKAVVVGIFGVSGESGVTAVISDVTLAPVGNSVN